MNRLLACTAVGLFLGLAPAVAEIQLPPPDRQDRPALDQSAQPSQPIRAQPSTPNAALPGNPDAANDDQSSEMAPESSPSDQALPSDQASPSPAIGEINPTSQSSEMAPESSPSGRASPSDQSAPPAIGEANPPSQSSEIPKSPEPPKSAEAAPSGAPFLAKQESSDWLVGNLIGKSVVNADNESIGNVNDLVTDQNGKLIAIVVGAGGFLGIGEKNVAIRFEDIKLARDENNDIKVIADISKEIIASAPDYQTLDEQQLTIGERSDQDTSR
jgi:sporulation protein YlmC with PRC-barrel domain